MDGLLDFKNLQLFISFLSKWFPKIVFNWQALNIFPWIKVDKVRRTKHTKNFIVTSVILDPISVGVGVTGFILENNVWNYHPTTHGQ